MEGLVSHLRALGFTEMDAKIVVSLSEQGAMTGYEVAKKLGVSRSNVYAALQRLVDQGVILHRKGDPSHYAVLSAKELTKLLATRLETSLRYVEKHMPAAEADSSSFYSVEGERAVSDTIKRTLHEAEREIIVDVWPDEAAELQEELLLAEARGVKVLWSIAGHEGRTTERIWPMSGTVESKPRHFAFVIDRRETLIGARGSGHATKALLTEHPAVTRLVLSHFLQEAVLYELEREMDLDGQRCFGERIEEIMVKYFD